MIKNKTLIAFTLIIIAGIVGIAIFNNSEKNSLPILEAKITSDNNSGNEIINIYSNGKIKRINSSSGKDFIKPIEVVPQTFEDHISNDNTVHITINQRQLKRNKQVLSDPIWIKIINYLAKHSQHSIAILNLYKLDDEYYFFVKYNAGLSDEGTLYKYEKHPIKICTLNSGKIYALRKL